ncbi:MAG TPA: GGDEF domain-containing protein [Burkholderiales bacterium]
MSNLRPAWLPAGIIVVTAIAAYAVRLPATLAGLQTLGPNAIILIAAVLAWWFNRGRSFVIAASLFGAFVAQQAFPGKPVYTLISVLVPLNAFAAMAANERGARHGAGWRWLALLAVEALLVIWLGRGALAAGGSEAVVLEHWALRSPPTPLVGRLAFAAAFAAAVLWRAWPDFTPLQVGNAGALAAFFIACEWARLPNVHAAFMAASGAILIAALLQESHRLAFRDELTGLPGRRALDERLRSLQGRRYTVAMVDVDHFKKFNDTHGHDTGDQVLKLVAARLAEVGGGGTAYRYGGEEFSVLFPGSELDEAFRHLEALRAAIELYRMAVRGESRPRKAELGVLNRDATIPPTKTLSVTVSIGAAQPDGGRLRTPGQVIKAADEALYRGKQGGRNKVAR